MTETIPRMKFTQVDESLVDDREQLAREARSVLGYGKLALAIATPGALLFALRKLDIDPLVKRSVDAYKAKKTKPGMWSGHKIAYLWMAAAATVFAVSRYYGSISDWDHTIFANFAVIIAAISGLICAIVGLIFRLDKSERGSRITRKWGRVAIGEYDGTVPEFALRKAVQIKTEVPSANLYIDQLYQEHERHVVVDPDPFLVVTLKDETYYIDVWDEKEYEAKL